MMALSMTLSHPAFQRAEAGFAENGRVYLVYADEALRAMPAPPMSESEAISAAIQVCQAIAFVHRRGLRLNDICPQSVALSGSGRIKLTGLDYVSNDNELAGDLIFNDGYTAPEIYRGKKTDKRADIFSAGALLYTWLTGERIESESWREEAGPVRFYPPHVVTPELEQAILRAIQFEPSARWATIDEFKAELTRLLAQFRVRIAAMTDVGMVRDHNEDAVMILDYVRDSLVDPDQNHLCVVCDGMGGAEAGEVAAAIAVKTIRDYVETRLASAEIVDPGKLMSAALEEANSKILEYVGTHPESRGMGSTGVTALVTPERRDGGVGRRQPRLYSRKRRAQAGDQGSFSRAAADRYRANHARTGAHPRAQERDYALARRAPERSCRRGSGCGQVKARRPDAAVQRRSDDPRRGQGCQQRSCGVIAIPSTRRASLSRRPTQAVEPITSPVIVIYAS